MAHTKKTIAGNVNNGTANTFSYSGSFDVFKASEVEVELDNIALTFTTSTINESADPREYTVDFTNKTVHIGGANLVSTNAVVIQPVTDMGAPTPRATYSPGASVTSADLNNNQLQVMRKAMEYDEQKLSSRGGTMTGNLHMGENVDISFEGSTENNFETTITVADPTSDKTITFPDTTGTVVTTGDTGTVATGMIAGDAITEAKIADDAINSEHITDGSVDLAHLSANSVDSSKIVNGSIVAADLASDSVTTAKITDSNVTTAKIADDNVTTAKIADSNVTTAKIADSNVTTAKIADSNITTVKIADSAITSAKIADGTIQPADLATGSVTTAKIADGNVTTVKIADANVTTAKIQDAAVTTSKIASQQVTGAKIANLQVGTSQLSNVGVTDAKLASNSVITSKITDANVTTVKIADSNVTLAKLASDLKQTSISDSDTQLPTSGAVVDYVAAQLLPFGGFEAIATEVAFPNTQPASGVAISISDAGGVVFNGSGTSTTGRTVGGSTVTINNAPSSLNGETLVAGVGLIVTSTGSSQIYNYHKILGKEDDIKQLSDDINDFNARYRVNAGEPGSNNDAGDLVYDTNANKMKVYDGSTSAWKEVTSTGDFKYLFLCPAGGSGAPTLNGTIATYDLRESSNSGSAASITNAAQLIVSINGVVQKANTGTSAPSEGFALVDSNTIIFGSNLESGDSVFVTQIGSAVTIPTPGDGTVSAAKIASGAVTTVKIADDAVTATKLASDAVVTDSIVAANVTTAKIANDAVTADQLASNAVVTASIQNSNVTTAKIADEAVTLAKLEHGTGSNDGKFLRANNGADPTFETINTTPANGSITSAMIADGTIVTADLADNAVSATKIADGNITGAKLQANSVSTAKIADDQVTTAKILNSQVTTAKIADEAITAAKIVGNSVEVNLDRKRIVLPVAFYRYNNYSGNSGYDTSNTYNDHLNGMPAGYGYSYYGHTVNSGYIAQGAQINTFNLKNGPCGMFMVELSAANSQGGNPYGNTYNNGLEIVAYEAAHHGWTGGSTTTIATRGTLHGSYTTSNGYAIYVTGGSSGTYYRVTVFA